MNQCYVIFLSLRRRAGQKCGRGYEGRKNWELLLQGTLAGKDSNFGGKVQGDLAGQKSHSMYSCTIERGLGPGAMVY